MFKAAMPFFLIVETPLHAGSGNDLGIIDLPIQRERHTGYPKIEGSSIKGCMRDQFEKKCDREREKIEFYFGPSNPRGDEARAGLLGFTDARLLLFPVKSLRGVFAWITCPGVLQRFVDDLTLPGVKSDVEKEFINSIREVSYVNDKTAVLSKGTNLEFGESIILEEYTFKVIENENKRKNCAYIAKWIADKVFTGDEYKYWSEKMKKDLVILSDNDFRDFVELSTEVITRTNINNETGTVHPGALFNEEYLPTDTVMYSMVLASPLNKDSEKEIIKFFIDNRPDVLQIGGNATIGKGLTRINVLDEGNNGGEGNG